MLIEENVAKTVSRLRRQGSDDANVEVKKGAGGVSKDVWSTISAFANSTSGGQIIFGLEEQSGFRLTPNFQPVSITDAVVTGLGDQDRAAAKVRPQPPYRIQTVPLDDSRVVVLDIEPLTPLNSDSAGPCYVVSQGRVNGAYKRVADQNQKLSDYEFYNLFSRWTPRPVDRDPINGMTTDDLDENLVLSLFQNVRASGSRALDRTENNEQKFARLSVINRDGSVTLAGGLSLGQYPQQFYPRLVIDVTVHPLETKEVIGQTRFLDRKVCDGPIPYMIQDAIFRVRSNLKTIRIVRGSHGTDEPEIPEDVLREAITNAVMHRDYSHFSQGERISVDVYPDRVEITSPGALIADRTTENIGDGHSVTRNTALANLLRVTPIPEHRGVIAETQGGGIPKMKAGMRQQGLPQPKFDVDVSSVKVTLHRHGLLDQGTRVWLDQLPGSSAREHQENLILALLRHRGQATVQDLRGILGGDSDDIRQLLGNLMAEELVAGRGDGPFRVPPPFLDSATVGETESIFTAAELEVLDVLNATDPLTVRDLSDKLDRTVKSLRPVLRRLVDAEYVLPTAPPQSRRRAYLRRNKK